MIDGKFTQIRGVLLHKSDDRFQPTGGGYYNLLQNNSGIIWQIVSVRVNLQSTTFSPAQGNIRLMIIDQNTIEKQSLDGLDYINVAGGAAPGGLPSIFRPATFQAPWGMGLELDPGMTLTALYANSDANSYVQYSLFYAYEQPGFK